MNILSVKNISKSFGGIHANSDISFDVPQGTILGVIGPNGAGKSTLFDLITGYTKPDQGEVYYKEKNIFGLRPDIISNLGVGRTFQKLKPFADQTLLENVIVGALVNEKNLKVYKMPGFCSLRPMGIEECQATRSQPNSPQKTGLLPAFIVVFSRKFVSRQDFLTYPSLLRMLTFSRTPRHTR